MIRTLLTFSWFAAFFIPAEGHELRPGFLDLRQSRAAEYVVRFKVPARGDMKLSLRVGLPSDCQHMETPRSERANDGIIDRIVVSCPNGLDGQEIAVEGLASTFTDVVVRAVRLDGAVQTARLTPDKPYFTLQPAPDWTSIAQTYFGLGLQHILLGFDHLLFVFVLLLLIRDPWMLVKTITAFTAAHSITLSAAALELAHAPQKPVEAMVAFSIVIAAVEVCRERTGGQAVQSRSPLVIAFVFGLLHGFGFGGALKEIGLPQSDVPLALLTFNIGVEAGQLIFIAAVLAFKASLDRLIAVSIPWAPRACAYGIGSLASTWFIQRMITLG